MPNYKIIYDIFILIKNKCLIVDEIVAYFQLKNIDCQCCFYHLFWLKENKLISINWHDYSVKITKKGLVLSHSLQNKKDCGVDLSTLKIKGKK